MRHITVHNASTGSVIGRQIVLADTAVTRMVGLLGKRHLGAGSGVLIRPSAGVHTFGMRFAIDVVALDRKMRVVKLWPRLRPFRVTSIGWKTNCVLELAEGEIARCKISRGDQLEIRLTAEERNWPQLRNR